MPADTSDSNLSGQIEKVVLAIHRRNGGRLKRLRGNVRLLEPSLLLDSLDLAEIMVAIEKRYGVSPFDNPSPPRTWGDVVRAVRRRQGTARARRARA